jgi:hypothetical protein
MTGDLHTRMASGGIGAQRLTALCNQHSLDDIEASPTRSSAQRAPCASIRPCRPVSTTPPH